MRKSQYVRKINAQKMKATDKKKYFLELFLTVCIFIITILIILYTALVVKNVAFTMFLIVCSIIIAIGIWYIGGNTYPKITDYEMEQIEAEIDNAVSKIEQLNAIRTSNTLIIFREKLIYRMKYSDILAVRMWETNHVNVNGVNHVGGRAFGINFELSNKESIHIRYSPRNIYNGFLDRLAIGYLRANLGKTPFDRLAEKLNSFNSNIAIEIVDDYGNVN